MPPPDQDDRRGLRAGAWSRLFARLYDAVMVPAERGPLARWRRAVAGPARGRVLEVAAGTGLDFPHYAPDALVVAVDLDVAMLRRAGPRAAAARATVLLVAADAERLPFRDGAFDAAVVGLALCTVPHPSRALAELGRLVRAGGAVRLLEHVRAPQPALARAQDWMTPVWRRVAGGCHLNRDTVRAVRESGLLLESVTAHARGVFVEVVARVPGPGAAPGLARSCEHP